MSTTTTLSITRTNVLVYYISSTICLVEVKAVSQLTIKILSFPTVIGLNDRIKT